MRGTFGYSSCPAWRSRTRVVRISQDRRSAVWSQACSVRPPTLLVEDTSTKSGPGYLGDKSGPGSEEDGRYLERVCCFALQGRCYYGNDCAYSHAFEKVTTVGCSYGPGCKLGHFKGIAVSDAAVPYVRAKKARFDPEEGIRFPCRPSSDCSIFDAARLLGRTAYMECSGQVYDDSDPLWDDLVCAIQSQEEGFEETFGASDLMQSVTDRLTAAGEYHLVDETVGEEWLLLSAACLRENLARAEDRLAKRHREWVHDELWEAEARWNELCDACRGEDQFQSEAGHAGYPIAVSGRKPIAIVARHQQETFRAELETVLVPVFKLRPLLPEPSTGPVDSIGQERPHIETDLAPVLATALAVMQHLCLTDGINEVKQLPHLIECLQRTAFVLASRPRSTESGDERRRETSSSQSAEEEAMSSSTVQQGRSPRSRSPRRPSTLQIQSTFAAKEEAEEAVPSLWELVSEAASLGDLLLVHHFVGRHVVD
ncbi:unnamed protein product [Polarella glacialis]|uniref:C3H1-type domain-containing protein n=1 Tax=Polarella glacialis TaxID=89957 RepID=A0A813LTT3_POLGL|nr:unnamed protein product [Polarella glacialis]